jgi:aminoglycoside 6'-N-acetyltransferase
MDDTPADRPSNSSRLLRGEIVVLRPAGSADIPALLAILEQPEVACWWRRAEWERIDEDDAVSFAVVVDDEVVGCIQFSEETDPDYLSAAIDIFISARVHGRGIGADAMRTLIGHLVTDRGHHRLTVDPAADNARAIRFYEKLGFRRVGVLRRYERAEDGVWRDGLLMEYSIAPAPE